MLYITSLMLTLRYDDMENILYRVTLYLLLLFMVTMIDVDDFWCFHVYERGTHASFRHAQLRHTDFRPSKLRFLAYISIHVTAISIPQIRRLFLEFSMSSCYDLECYFITSRFSDDLLAIYALYHLYWFALANITTSHTNVAVEATFEYRLMKETPLHKRQQGIITLWRISTSFHYHGWYIKQGLMAYGHLEYSLKQKPQTYVRRTDNMDSDMPHHVISWLNGDGFYHCSMPSALIFDENYSIQHISAYICL